MTTEFTKGAVHAYHHEEAGVPLARQFLRRFTKETKLIGYVLNMTELHMKPNTAANVVSSVKVTNRMFDQAVDPDALICIALADDRGRITEKELGNHLEFLDQRLKIYREYMARPYVMGRDLIEAGLEPGKEFTQILAHAHKLRLAGIPKEQAMKQVLSFARQLQKEKQP